MMKSPSFPNWRLCSKSVQRKQKDNRLDAKDRKRESASPPAAARASMRNKNNERSQMLKNQLRMAPVPKIKV
jgi:hypothetical protein